MRWILINFIVDEVLCSRCGSCVEDCPVSIIELNPFPVIHKEESCIHCQHCLAVCPEGAISILGRDPKNSIRLKDNFPNPQQLAVLIRGRRSVRSYQEKDVDPNIIRDLISTVWHAPTGRNLQPVLLTVLDQRMKAQNLREKIYQKLPFVLENEPQTDIWMIKYLRWANKMWTKRGEDPILMGAPHAIITSFPKGFGTGLVDSHISLAYFELMAQSMGLGTLWNGIFHAVLSEVLPEICGILDIPVDHQIGYTMVFGYPQVEYYRTVQRDPASVNWVQELD